MARKVKPREERRLEIIDTSERLFHELGYAECSVDTIIREIGVAKGTFYYYFKSKEDILSAIVDRTLDQIIEQAEQVADDPSLDAIAKMELLLSGGSIGDQDVSEITEIMHLPANRELHELTNIQTVLRLSPPIARIVEQGKSEGVFNVEHVLETVQFLLTGAQFLTEGGRFQFSQDELALRRIVVQNVIERALGAQAGSFAFMNPGTT